MKLIDKYEKQLNKIVELSSSSLKEFVTIPNVPYKTLNFTQRLQLWTSLLSAIFVVVLLGLLTGGVLWGIASFLWNTVPALVLAVAIVGTVSLSLTWILK